MQAKNGQEGTFDPESHNLALTLYHEWVARWHASDFRPKKVGYIPSQGSFPLSIV
jgi:hypothetical protein